MEISGNILSSNTAQNSLHMNLSDLRFENGKLINSKKVLSSLENSIVDYLIEKKGKADDFPVCLDELLFQIRPFFPTESSFLGFINQLVTRLRDRKDLMLEKMHTQEQKDALTWAIYYATDKCLSTIREIGRRIEESPLQLLKTVAGSIDSQMPLEIRYEVAQQVKVMLSLLASQGKIVKKSRQPEIEEKKLSTFEDIENLSATDPLFFKYSDGSISSAGLNETIDNVKKIENEMKNETPDEIG